MKKTNIQYITQVDSRRIATGVVSIDGDWPGVFIRGDSALMYLCELKYIRAVLLQENHLLNSLIELLDSSNVSNQED